MDQNKIRLQKLIASKATSKRGSVQVLRGEEAAAVWPRLGYPLRDGVTLLMKGSCSCGAQAGLWRYDGQFYAFCSVCDAVVVVGEDEGEVVAVWAREVERL